MSEPKIFMANIADLKPSEENPRKIGKAELNRLAEKMKKYPKHIEAREVVIDENFKVLGGHQRIKAAKQNGKDQILVKQVFGWTEEEKREFIINDNIAEGEWDDEKLKDWDEAELEGWGAPVDWEEDNDKDYEKFVDKFKPKLTTDDCYTPQPVFDAVEKWVRNHYQLGNVENIRPFKPGGDYQSENYEGKIVIDNPPFSILSQIVRWYHERGVKFFLFAPHLTLIGAAVGVPTQRVIACARITYENGAIVPTSFITNMAPELGGLFVAGSLRAAIEEVQPDERPRLEKYVRPKNLLMASDFAPIAENGVDWIIPNKELHIVSATDEMKAAGKELYGAGMLVSDRVAERVEEEKRKSKKEPMVIRLSEREQKIVDRLNGEEEAQDGTKT